MRFIHIADVHLGAKPEIDTGLMINREQEIYDSFIKVIQLCEERKIDLLLIAGDLFHRQPLLRELKEINYFMSQLTHTKIVLMAGNHDYISSRSNYLQMSWSENVHIFSTSDMDSIYFEDINTEVYGFSYLTRDIYEDKYSKVYAGVEERINILLAHGGDERNIPINYKQLEDSAFDYIALGHIHKPNVFSQRMAYSGSLEPLDKNEIGEHGYIEGCIEKQGQDKLTRRICFVPYSIREYKRINIPVNKEATNYSIQEEIKNEMVQMGEQHMYQIRLNGFRDPEMIMDIIKIKELGNIIEVIDETRPDYDFKVLYQENQENLIGAYINKIQTVSKVDEAIKEKALYYGLQALLNSKER